MRQILIPVTLLAALPAACSGGSEPAAEPTPTAENSSGLNYIAEVEKLPQEQQNIVFIRAIRDARRECQGVVGSVKATEVGPGAWRVRCTDGGGHLIRISANGDGRVTSSR
ncbi:hypothetical protein ACNI3Q_02370 [Sphingomonas sp. FW199]|uniref:hypothetical protein n=1 Tax=Sphingomonas sp. FW199 TaxID=3400217 RepID=UPI003CE6C8D7